MAPKRTVGSNAKVKMKRKAYEQELRKLQVELCHLQDWVKKTGARIIILFEGRDAAGKGGTIKAITERVSPRVFRVVALPASSDREKTQMFGQRYIEQFPAAGEIVIFDRSWYNRAGVEYVMGFCSEHDHRRFLELIPQIEKYIVDDGIHLLKIWLEVGQGEQERRFNKPDGPGVVPALVRLLPGTRHDAEENRQQARALVYRTLGRQTASTAQLYFPYPQADPVREGIAAEGQAAQALE
jgi:polyphosphate kinase 2 (PPK2 family)